MNRERLILVVEDDQILRFLTRRQLEVFGYQCKIAENGLQAVEMLRETKFDLIFMDVHMPKMNGIDATRAIRKYEAESGRTGYTPIVALTANPERQQCFDAGMNDFIFKPVTLDDMEKMLKRWLVQ